MRRLVAAITVMILMALLAPPNVTANAPPQLIVRVTPMDGAATTEFTFLITYSDAENIGPASIHLYLNGVRHDPMPVDPADTNYTNGKDYYYTTTLDKGVTVFYAKASDGANEPVETRAGMVEVFSGDVFEFDTEHGDLLKGACMASVPAGLVIIFVCFQLFRISRALNRKEKKDEAPEIGDEAGEKADGEKKEDNEPAK